jgi:hypothetical protein
LVAVSAVLDLPWDYLVNIMDGRPDKNVAKSLREKHLAKLVDQLPEIDALRREVARLKDIVHEIDRKIDVSIGLWRSSGDARGGA